MHLHCLPDFKKSKDKILYHCEICDKDLQSSLTFYMKMVHKKNEVKAELTQAEMMDITLTPLKKKGVAKKPNLSYFEMVAQYIKKNSIEVPLVMEIYDKFMELSPFFKSNSEAGVQKLIKMISTTLGKNWVFVESFFACGSMHKNWVCREYVL